MSIRQPAPAETDLLCEFCGYTLNGLAGTGASNCPECGEPLAPSIEPGHRQPAPVERVPTPAGAFCRTTRDVILRKRRFFRETISRPATPGAEMGSVTAFGRRHRLIAGVGFGLAAAVHGAWMAETRGWVYRWSAADVALLAVAGGFLVVGGVLLMAGVTRLAARLTTTESRFWGMRLPRPVVARALDFHAANYLPVAALALLLTAGFRLALLLGLVTPIAGVPYLVALSAAVVAGALWLFESYVIAMRRIRYANY